MKCPSCEMITKDTAYCSNCGVDLLLYDKVHMMAVRLYNKGLAQAQGRCLSGAIESLTMCIRLQKNHIDARNLLGLIYWEIGEVGQAIKYWVTSLSYQEKNNLANDYLETVQGQPSQLARCGDTMILFNKSLQYIAQGSGDIAIISLRKALSQNPNYVAAKVLLSLYYITKKEDDKAVELLREVLQTSKDHPMANHYWNDLNPELKMKQDEPRKTTIPKVAKIQATAQGGASTMIQPKPLIGNIIAFIIGAVCMLGVYMILITPSKTADLKQQIKAAQEKGNQLQEKLELVMVGQEETIKTLEDEKASLEKVNENLKQEQAVQEQILGLQASQNLLKEKEWLQAANKLTNINRDSLGEERKIQYDALLKEVYPKAGEQLYNEGNQEYRSKNYIKAIEILEKAYIYAKEERFSDNILYILGRSYEAQENMEQAKQYYQSTIDNYPGTDGAASAKKRLR
ncbi:MAG TPA: tetratricopeptide repeat protein [Epulopiscium sp.]|nr:tetratricopeptide repeat protein [Candidatus Epulonipiscium sp.]